MSGTVPTSAQDVVAVFDADFNQLFADARTMKVDVKEIGKLMKHPIENGESVVDHLVVEPIEIVLSMVLTPETLVDTYNQIKQIFLGANVLQVQTNVALYGNMAIEALPHKEDPEHFDTITMQLKLSECQFVTASVSQLPDAPQNGGNKNGTPATTTQTNQANETVGPSVLYGWTH